MPNWLGALFLIASGSGVLAVAYHGWQEGELPAGQKACMRTDPIAKTTPWSSVSFSSCTFAAALRSQSGGCQRWSEWRRRWSCGECWESLTQRSTGARPFAVLCIFKLMPNPRMNTDAQQRRCAPPFRAGYAQR